jgi:glycosyltransferase involved in cell wall biosynthesis
LKNNVLVTATTFPRWKDDKVPAFVFDLSLQYKKLGWNVTVLAPHYPGAKFKEELEGLQVYRFPYFFPTKFERVAYNGGILGNLNRSFLAKLQIPFFLLMDFLYMFFIVNLKRIDVIHSHWIISQGFIASIVSMLTRKKHICTLHAGDIALLEKIPLRKMLSSFIFHNSKKLVFVSNYGLQQTFKITSSNNLKDKALIIPMGVYINKKQNNNIPRKNGGAKNILFIGRLSEKKGIPFLLDAFSTVSKMTNSVKLTIAGDGPDLDNLKKLCNDLRISNKVYYPGYVTGEDKEHYLNQADILVVPSIETDQGDTEGLPVVILEGMSRGVPIVATDVGGISEVIKDNYNGRLIPQKNESALAESIIDLLTNFEKRSRISQNAKTTAESYSWGEISKKYSELLQLT